MSMGKFLASLLVLSGVIAGAAMYYLQVYHFYEEVAPQGDDIQLVALATQKPMPITHAGFEAIDANSSPIRYRACFMTDVPMAELAATFTPFPKAEPRNAPHWFDCFDAAAIASELKAGTAQAYLSQKNIAYGVDRIVAITAKGRGYVWHEPNGCGAKAYDGSLKSEACPERPQAAEGQN